MDNAVLPIFAIVAAVGILGLVVVEGDNIVKQIQAYAAGCRTSQAFNASKGRCFGHGPT